MAESPDIIIRCIPIVCVQYTS